MTDQVTVPPPGGAAPLVRLADAAEVASWDALVASNPGGGEVWMSDAYLEQKREGRYAPRRLVVELADGARIAVGALAKRVPLLGEWWHLPAGPAGRTAEEVLAVAGAVAGFARARGAFLMKVEPRLPLDARALFDAAGYLPCARIIPNSSTVLVDTSGTEDEVFARLGKKARNSINRARRDGIVVRRVPASDEHCAAFYRLLQETAEGRFVLRGEAYYRSFWQRFERSGQGQLFFAFREEQPDGAPGERLLAGAFAMGLAEKTTYKDGASLREKAAYGASHALQWEVIRWANERGALVHDLCGAPPADRAGDTAHPLHGVGTFKRSFQPEITDYVGAVELPLRGGAYRVWSTIGDRLVRRWSLAVRHDPYY